MPTEKEIQDRETKIEELGGRWSWLMTNIRDSRNLQKRKYASEAQAIAIMGALDENYSATLECILQCAKRERSD